MTCKHMNFDASVAVARFEDTGGFMAEIRIHCRDCKKPFQFLGLEPGIDMGGARVSIDGLEANIAICAEGEKPNPLHLIWVVAQDSGEIWSFQNHLVRLQSNITMGRDTKKPSIYERMAGQQAQPRTWYRGTLDVEESLVQAANDAHLFGSGYIQFLQGEDGKVTARRVQPADISIHREPIKEENS